MTVPAPTLRPERPEDAAFLFDLFAADAGALLRAAGLPADAAAHLVAIQHRSRSETYRARYPDGRFHIVEADGAPIGRLVEADEPGLVHIVDLAILPARRRQGHAAALLRAALPRWAAAGRGARAHVHVGNDASLRLFRGLGFIGTPDAGAAQVTLRWP